MRRSGMAPPGGRAGCGTRAGWPPLSSPAPSPPGGDSLYRHDVRGTEAACHAPPSGAADQAPPVKVLTQAADDGNGDIFVAPQGCGYPSGPEIISNTGRVIWFHGLPAGEFATDFRTQSYQGRPVLTWFRAGA